jgi:hypothetical protein
MHKKGDRVGAISHSKEGIVYFFGYGTYEGDEVPPPGIRFMGVELSGLKQENPKIQLDSGKVVWGCECWWGPEEKVRKALEGAKEVVEVDIEVARMQAGAKVVK